MEVPLQLEKRRNEHGKIVVSILVLMEVPLQRD